MNQQKLDTNNFVSLWEFFAATVVINDSQVAVNGDSDGQCDKILK